MKEYEIKTVKSEKDLKRVYHFLSKTFYEDAIEYNEHYYNMADRYKEMLDQLKKDNELLLYIEDNNEIIGAVTTKDMDEEKQKITLSIIAVDKNYREKGLAASIIKELEKRCLKRNIIHIGLGARFRACPLYVKLGYKPTLMVQVYDFVTIEDIKKENIFNLEIDFEFQGDTNGFIFYKVNEVKKEYADHFEKNVKTAHASYTFGKKLK